MKKSIHDENPTIDLEFLSGIIENDKEFEKELFEIFIENAKKNIDKLESATDIGNDSDWYMASHAFKGAATSIGAFNLAETLEEAQQSPGKSVAIKKAILVKIKDEFDKVLLFIKDNKIAH